jgi:hypothetical protein
LACLQWCRGGGGGREREGAREKEGGGVREREGGGRVIVRVRAPLCCGADQPWLAFRVSGGGRVGLGLGSECANLHWCGADT